MTKYLVNSIGTKSQTPNFGEIFLLHSTLNIMKSKALLVDINLP